MSLFIRNSLHLLRAHISPRNVTLLSICDATSVRCLSICPKVNTSHNAIRDDGNFSAKRRSVLFAVPRPIASTWPYDSRRSFHNTQATFAEPKASPQPSESKDDKVSDQGSTVAEPVLGLGSEPGEPKETLFQRFKRMAKQYWYVLIPVHIVTTVFWVGGFYLLAKSGLDLAAILERLGAPEVLMKPVRNSNAGYYAVTYACYKLATPLRYVVTIGGTTLLVRLVKQFQNEHQTVIVS